MQYTVKAEEDGLRLDACLAGLFPQLGLRARRRLWEWNLVLVNGKPGKPGSMVRAGALVELRPLPGGLNGSLAPSDCPARSGGSALYGAVAGLAATGAPDPGTSGSGMPVSGRSDPGRFDLDTQGGLFSRCRLVAQNADYAAFYKPPGLPSAHIQGSPLPSLETFVAANAKRLFPGMGHSACGDALPGNCSLPCNRPLPCNRLDTPTSGLVIYALGPETVERFRQMEQAGRVNKSYHAIVHGRLEQPLALRRALNMNNRNKTTVLPQEDADPARHTLVYPVGEYFFAGAAGPADSAGPAQTGSGLPCTLVRAEIKRGARHQIRAHLAGAGFPIVGDALYGPEWDGTAVDGEEVANKAPRLYLHCRRVEMPGFAAEAPEDW